MNTMQLRAADYIAQYNAGAISIDKLHGMILKLQPHTIKDVEHLWWVEDINNMFYAMECDSRNIAIYLGNGSSSLLSYLETPEQ